MQNIAKLIYACNADSFYATNVEISDPYIFLQDSQGKSHAVFNALEIDHAKKDTTVDHVHSLESLIELVKSEDRLVNTVNTIKVLLNMTGTEKVIVDNTFPAGIYKGLVDLNIDVIIENNIFPQRIIKSQEEIEKIRQAQATNEEGFKLAFDILEKSTIGEEDILYYEDKVLTSQILRNKMNAKICELGGIANEGGPIIACGKQGAEPHNRGEGPLYANQLIVMDSFPMSSNLYYGDLTRTVIKGKANKKQEALYNAVKKAQQIGLDTAKANIKGNVVHNAIQASFKEDDYHTGIDTEGRRIGFIHSTGHNVGLDLHDIGPGISIRDNILQENQVLTIEPGLYYPEIGGVRIEDIVLITKDGIENLTTLPKTLIIK